MQCSYCGGWHYGTGTPPPVNYTPPPMERTTAHDILQGAMSAVYEQLQARKDPYDQDVLPHGKPGLWGPRVYGTDERGEEVTVVFGDEDGTREGHVMISDSHVSGWKFYQPDERGVKGHDHIGPGPSPDEQRGKYTGWSNFHDPE